MSKCVFNDAECVGPATFITENDSPVCSFHNEMLEEMRAISMENNKKDRYAIIREGPIFTPGQMVKVAMFLEEHNECSVLGELHYAAAKEIVEKLNKE